MQTVMMVVIIVALVIGAVYAGFGTGQMKRQEITDVICTNTNCGYKGEPGRKKQFSYIVFSGLLLCGILPAIVYAVAVPRYKYWCPECQTRLKI